MLHCISISFQHHTTQGREDNTQYKLPVAKSTYSANPFTCNKSTSANTNKSHTHLGQVKRPKRISSHWASISHHSNTMVNVTKARNIIFMQQTDIGFQQTETIHFNFLSETYYPMGQHDASYQHHKQFHPTHPTRDIDPATPRPSLCLYLLEK